MLSFQLIKLLIGGYVLWRGVWRLPTNRWLKLVLSVLVVLGAMYHGLIGWRFGSIFSPEWSYGWVLAGSFLFAWVVLWFGFLLLADIGLALCWLVRRLLRRSGSLDTRGLCWAVFVLALGMALFGVWRGVSQPDVRRVDLMVRGLPEAWEGKRLVQLTDLHISRLFPRSWAEKVVAQTNALHPDVIVITGDLIDGLVHTRLDDIAPLANLRAPLGVWAITGNHEYYFNAPEWKQHFATLGMKVLANQHVVLMQKEQPLVLAGLNDWAALRFGLPGPNLKQALEGVPAGVPIILLNHQPRGARTFAKQGVAAQLSGHTHGGMVWGLNALVARANEGFVSGLYDVDGMQLYVSNGTGIWNGFPVRLSAGAEITEFVLHRAP